MKKTLLFVLALSGLSALSAHVVREYHYAMYSMTRSKAQLYCRKWFTDLATVENQDDNSRLLSAWEGLRKSAWIGLNVDVNRWKWALGNENLNSDFTPWLENDPDYAFPDENCVVMKEDGRWYDTGCSKTFASVCYYERGPAKYIFVHAKMTWENARTYCRSKYTDLVSVRNMSESSMITSLMSERAWIGLHREPLVSWDDQTPTTFTNWYMNEPDNNVVTKKSCVLIDRDTGKWRDVDCNERQQVFCQKIIDHSQRTTFKLKFQSEADLNDPAVQEQILTQLHSKLEKHGLPDFKLRWIQTDGQTFHKEQERKKEKGCG